MDAREIEADLTEVLVTEAEIHAKLAELARRIEVDYEGKDLLLVGVLKGAVMVMADLARELRPHVNMDWMAVSSYGAGTQSSGVVRIVKDLDTDLTGRHVLIVEDIIDSGLTLSWLLGNLESRGAESVEICALLRKPDAAKVEVTSSTSASTSRTSSWSATGSTTPSSTATCATSRSSRRTCTAEARAARESGPRRVQALESSHGRWSAPEQAARRWRCLHEQLAQSQPAPCPAQLPRRLDRRVGLHGRARHRRLPRRRRGRRRARRAAAHGAVGDPRPLLSPIADRGRRERVLILVSIVRGVATAAAAVVVAVSGPSAVVYALAVLSTIAATLYRPAHSALLPSLCRTGHELASANMVRGLLDSAATLVGPLLAAVLLQFTGVDVVFCGRGRRLVRGGRPARADAVRRPAASAGAEPARPGREAVEGVRAVVQNRDLTLILGLAAAQALTRGALTVFSVVVAIELLGTGEPGVGALMTAVGVGAVLGSLAASLLVGTGRLGAWFAVGVGLWGLPLTLVALVPQQSAALGLLAFIGVGNALIDSPGSR